METINRILSIYAAYFGIVAAILALGSWLATNYFGSIVQSASEALRQAEANFRTSANFRRIYSLVDEETQTLDHVYEIVRKPSQSADRGAKSERERYDTLLRMQYTRHGDRAVFLEMERAEELADLVRTLDLHDDGLDERASKIREDVSSLLEQRQSARKKAEAAIASAGAVYEISDSDWQLVAAAIEAHRELVEIKLVPEQNRVSHAIAELESDLIRSQRQEFERRKSASAIVKRIAFALYLTSAILALYGKWLEVRYPKTKETAISLRDSTSKDGSDRVAKVESKARLLF